MMVAVLCCYWATHHPSEQTGGPYPVVARSLWFLDGRRKGIREKAVTSNTVAPITAPGASYKASYPKNDECFARF